MRNPAAFAVMVRERKILMVRLGAYSQFMGLWTFPGGFVDPGETMTEAAIREVKEETGLNLIIDYSLWRGEGPHERRPVEIFVGQGSGELVVQDDELDEAVWFDIDEALTLDLAYDCYARLLEVKAALNFEGIGAYDGGLT